MTDTEKALAVVERWLRLLANPPSDESVYVIEPKDRGALALILLLASAGLRMVEEGLEGLEWDYLYDDEYEQARAIFDEVVEQRESAIRALAQLEDGDA